MRRWTAAGDCCFDAARGHVCLARARTALLGLGIPSPGRLLACLAPFALARSPRGARAERFSMLRKLTITEPHASALELRFCGGGSGGGEMGAGAAPGEAVHQQGAPQVVSGGSPWASAATGALRLERLVISSCAATEIKARHGCRAQRGHGIASAESQQPLTGRHSLYCMHGEPATLCAIPPPCLSHLPCDHYLVTSIFSSAVCRQSRCALKPKHDCSLTMRHLQGAIMRMLTRLHLEREFRLKCGDGDDKENAPAAPGHALPCGSDGLPGRAPLTPLHATPSAGSEKATGYT